jgi:hypothetical protein
MSGKPKSNTETSSMSISSENAHPKRKERLKIFASTNGHKKLTVEEIELLKKRKRYIKNNKFVYLHPNSAAAKRLAEKVKIIIN